MVGGVRYTPLPLPNPNCNLNFSTNTSPNTNTNTNTNPNPHSSTLQLPKVELAYLEKASLDGMFVHGRTKEGSMMTTPGTDTIRTSF
jgi:hypothetical protein